MEIESIMFDTEAGRLVVTYANGTVTTYTMEMKDQYLIDNPERLADVTAMGWM